MRKRVLIAFVLALALIALPLLGACAEKPEPTPTPPKPIDLTYSIFFPPTHYHSILAQAWAEEINERTDGVVTITCYPGGSLTPAPQVYDGVVEGLSDIGMSCLAYTMGRFPSAELVDLPHGYPNGWVATKVANDFYQNFKPAEFDDVHVLYFHAHGPGVVFTTKKPVRTLEDMKGLVLRSTGVGAKIAEALGATGYAAGQGDAYELMSKGTIDGSMTPREVLKGWKQAEVVKYVTNCLGVGYTTDMFVVMNNDKWNALPADIQKVFNEVTEEWIDKHGKVWDWYDSAGIEFFNSLGEGREVIELSDDEMARWVEAAKVVKDTYMLEKGAAGLPVFDYESYISERVAYWTPKSPTLAESYDWVEANVTPLAAK